MGRNRPQRRVRLEHRIGLRTHAADLIEVVHHRHQAEAGSLSSAGALDHAIEQGGARGPWERVVRHMKSE